MCVLEEFGVFPGPLHTKPERYADETLEGKGDGSTHAALGTVMSHTGLLRGTSPDLPLRKQR